MVTPYGKQLAVHVISSCFGDNCAKVGECLLQRGILTLAQIINYTKLTKQSVVNCLLVLIKQNCVQPFTNQEEGAFGEAPKMVTKYMAMFDLILHKLRGLKFCLIVSQELDKRDKRCLEIFQGLLHHGRLFVHEMIERSSQIAASAKKNSGDSISNEAGGSKASTIRESIERLVNARFIERCPAPEPFLGEEEDAPKKRVPKAAEIPQEQLTLEQRVVAAACAPPSLRFLLEMDDLSSEMAEEGPIKLKLGEKRKQSVLVSCGDKLDADRMKEAYWRVNFEELMHRLRNKACVSYITQTFDKGLGIVLSAILMLSGVTERGVKAGKLASLTINAIHDEVIKTEPSMDLMRVRASLDQLSCVSDTTRFEESYIFDLKPIVERAQDVEVESVVLRRHGKEAYRIFRSLSRAKCSHTTDKIAQTITTSASTKDTIKLLNKLWNDGYLVRDSEKDPSSTRQLILQLWSVNKGWVREQVLDEMYHAALNLKLRLAHEIEQREENLRTSSGKVREDKEERLKRLRAVMEDSLNKLDDSIMLFHDFYSK